MNLYKDTQLFGKIMNMVQDLEMNKLSSNDVKEFKLLRNERLDKELIKKNLFIIMTGVIQTECGNGNITDFIREGEVLFVQPIRNDKQQEWLPEYKAITSCKIIQVSKEFFLNFSSIKPSYMELILQMTANKLMYVMNDSRKYDLSVEERFDFSLAELGHCLGEQVEDNSFILPRYINKNKIASFSKTSRKYTSQRLQLLENNGNINADGNNILISSIDF
ncbi:Crp/Fnr family transcriptional regulator [Listeria booriae]|uniref:Crp/Fnr family transcriptional regulator n=1 Tax=Listeria booriae TaxID=1552123 RepID=A0A7X0XYP6_9LIST|nr:Crp/Fnr family transcriptional regulator [Listeria booriae]MBC1794194.1 Crp/Fnr family transcriptional regulator [Listeria booriae]MBC1795788.1 Crp/Fnr family transcriptional regulator [Listeria booriae]MBC1800103.1 Crp/Fnr family transcriptional regulator [Listeria booriae]MBC1813607.1 Crp/Fnr family transcriptional regulator [Listeria booriae]MDT0111248.1 Crp/Fnr family transcriptional regulator [Listeria booriae]